MTCKCIKETEKKLKKEFGGSVEFTNAVLSLNVKNGSSAIEPPLLRFKYHKNKADGTLSKKWTESFIVSEYCQFCGKKKEKKQSKGSRL